MNSYIHFIRHGFSVGNAHKWYYGWADLPLTEDGITQLKALQAQGIYPPLQDADCYTSGLLRTEQTLQAIYGDVPHRTIPAMKEMNFGRWECKTFEELQREPEFDLWMADKTGDFVFPGGDSILSFYARVQGGLKELMGYHRLKELSHRHSGKDAVSVMICHGGVISACMENLFPAQKPSFWDWIPDPGHGYTVCFDHSDPTAFTAF